MPAVVRRSLASGAAIASADGLADGPWDDDEVVADAIEDGVADDIVDTVGEADMIPLFVPFEFEGNKVESGKKSDTTGMMIEGSMLEEFVTTFFVFNGLKLIRDTDKQSLINRK